MSLTEILPGGTITKDLISLEPCTFSAFLVFQESGQRREVCLDAGDVWKLGRSAKCTIEIKDETISRNHAMIQRADSGEYYFIDLGSQNGSFVNDRRVSTPEALRNNDRISMGRTIILFRNPSEASDKRPPSLNDFESTRQIFAQRLVTTLVVDIRDYTVLTKKTAQSVLGQLIGNWFNEAERIMQKHGSGVQKYIGDAVMALWVHEKVEQEQCDVLQALHALTEFAEATAELSRQFRLPESLRIGAGLNTGAAALGSPGTGDLTALGDSVNATFRLEKATKELKSDLILGSVTFDYLEHLPHSGQYFHPGEVMLKGYADPVKTFAASFAELRHFLERIDRGAAEDKPCAGTK